MKLDQFRDVVAIAECGGMRPAARKLGVPQPGLTRSLRNLEREIGGKLFERQVRGMVPTALGRVVIDVAGRVLAEIRGLSDKIAGLQRYRRKSARPLASGASRVDRDRTEHVFTDLVLETFRLNGKLLAAGDRLVKPINLTSARWQVLGSLHRNRATVSEIARYMGLQRQSVQRTMDLLRKEGLVELIDNPNHRRAKHAVLTAKGRKTIKQANVLRDEWRSRTTAGISSDELETAYQVMRRIRRRLGDRSATVG